MAAGYLRPHGDGVVLEVHVQPGASRTVVVGRHGDRLKIKVASPPVDDRANAELCRHLAELFDLPKGRVQVAAGARGRQKRLVVHGLSPAAARQALARVLGQEDQA